MYRWSCRNHLYLSLHFLYILYQKFLKFSNNI